MLEDVGVFVAADPAQGKELERAASDVGVKRGEFKAADIERNAHFAQLLLENGGEQARGFLGRGLHVQVEAVTVLANGVSGLIEKLRGRAVDRADSGRHRHRMPNAAAAARCPPAAPGRAAGSE